MRTYAESITGDGDGNTYIIESTQGPDELERVFYTIDGTWGSGTVTLTVCIDTEASPQVFTDIPDGAFTADTAGYLNLPYGALIKGVTSGSTSPALTLTVRGDIKIT